MADVPPAATVPELLAAGAADAIAVQGAGGRDATFADLRATVDALGGQLRGAGVSANERAALVLPNGPGMAAAFLAAATAGTAAPLNPRYREEELRLSFQELRVRVVVAAPDAEEIPAVPGVRRLDLQGDGLDLTLTEDGQPVPS
ncbi:MAG: AMP-binding protein, partial [Dehalococcoidia bacterium]|nr:AMP-binding protein [Dehalococcoidia bacterium]